ncbi:MAG: hypothetical protein ACRESE_04815 [Gammaproteobacteria bacterium]
MSHLHIHMKPNLLAAAIQAAIAQAPDIMARCPPKWAHVDSEGPLVSDMLNRVIIPLRRSHSPNNFKRSHSDKDCAYKTARDRKQILKRGAAELQLIDPELKTLDQLKPWHLAILFGWLGTRHLADKTVFDIAVAWRGTLKFLGLDPQKYLPRHNTDLLSAIDVPVTYVPGSRDRSLTGNGINFEALIGKIEAIDPLVGAIVRYIKVRGLRVKEGLLFRPHADVDLDQNTSRVIRGAKSGRRRNPSKQIGLDETTRSVIIELQKFAHAEKDSLIPPHLTLRQFQAHFYRVMEQVGFTKHDCGTTPVGFRYELAQVLYKSITGEWPPIRGGGHVSAELDYAARKAVASFLGHNRIESCIAYLGQSPYGWVTQKSNAQRPNARTRAHLRGPWIL